MKINQTRIVKVDSIITHLRLNNIRVLIVFVKPNIYLKYIFNYKCFGTGISCKYIKFEYLSFFIITKLFLKSESLLLFKLIYLMVPIGKKPTPPATTNPV